MIGFILYLLVIGVIAGFIARAIVPGGRIWRMLQASLPVRARNPRSTPRPPSRQAPTAGRRRYRLVISSASAGNR